VTVFADAARRWRSSFKSGARIACLGHHRHLGLGRGIAGTAIGAATGDRPRCDHRRTGDRGDVAIGLGSANAPGHAESGRRAVTDQLGRLPDLPGTAEADQLSSRGRGHLQQVLAWAIVFGWPTLAARLAQLVAAGGSRRTRTGTSVRRTYSSGFAAGSISQTVPTTFGPATGAAGSGGGGGSSSASVAAASPAAVAAARYQLLVTAGRNVQNAFPALTVQRDVLMLAAHGQFRWRENTEPKLRWWQSAAAPGPWWEQRVRLWPAHPGTLGDINGCVRSVVEAAVVAAAEVVAAAGAEALCSSRLMALAAACAAARRPSTSA